MLEVTYAEKLSVPIKDKQTKEKRERVLTDLPEFAAIREHLHETGYGMDMEGVRGTVYGLFNGITQYESHHGNKSEETTERNRARLESLYGGKASKRINAAHAACLALV